MTDEVPQFPREVLPMTLRDASIYWALRREVGRRIADCGFATRLSAEDFFNSDEWARRDGGHVSRRDGGGA